MLACVGIYGVMAYRVAQRTQEIGVRLALGAEPGQMRSMVLREAGLVAAAGVLSGLVAVALFGGAVLTMLYGLQAVDPLSLSAAAALLVTVAILSAWFPALRAARMQPLDAIRHE